MANSIDLFVVSAWFCLTGIATTSTPMCEIEVPCTKKMWRIVGSQRGVLTCMTPSIGAISQDSTCSAILPVSGLYTCSTPHGHARTGSHGSLSCSLTSTRVLTLRGSWLVSSNERSRHCSQKGIVFDCIRAISRGCEGWLALFPGLCLYGRLTSLLETKIPRFWRLLTNLSLPLKLANGSAGMQGKTRQGRKGSEKRGGTPILCETARRKEGRGRLWPSRGQG